jgi:predicted molibdopterin-dependent oxidoreductase YjgC
MNIIIDGKEVTAESGQTILQVARANGVHIPTLCHSEALEPAAMCRLCTVEVDEGRGPRLVTACNYPLRRYAEVWTNSEKVRAGRKLIIELLYTRCPSSELLKELAEEYGVDLNRFSPNDKGCIVCGLCARVCEQVGGKTLTLSGRGVEICVATAFNRESEYCIVCGACARICPVKAIRILEEDGYRSILVQGRVASRVKLNECLNCGKRFGPVIDLKEITERAGEVKVPPLNQSVCPDCSRRSLAARMAERHFEQYETGEEG